VESQWIPFLKQITFNDIFSSKTRRILLFENSGFCCDHEQRLAPWFYHLQITTIFAHGGDGMHHINAGCISSHLRNQIATVSRSISMSIGFRPGQS
jgi:hypothetical protein